MTTAVVTIVHGRHGHLARQAAALARTAARIDAYVVVAIDDPLVRGLVEGAALPTHVLELPASPLGLPLAAARNLGAEHAIRSGADALLFLDADCIPGCELVAEYAAALREPATADLLLCGPVAYLPPEVDPDLPTDALDLLVAPHPARPAPSPGETTSGVDHALFWSLSFALRAGIWRRIGGFCERYVGYGAEDTDFAATAKRLGIGLAFVGGARAYHQHHPTSSPPVQHLADIVRNANLYRERWGSLPMAGWLAEFERRGLVELDAGTVRLAAVEHAPAHRGP